MTTNPGELFAQAEATIAEGKALIASDLPKATDLLNRAVKMFWALNDQYRAAAEIGNYGWALRRMGRPDLARTYLLSAADLFQQMGLTDFEQRHRSAAEQADTPITPELLEGMPPAVRGALERGDLPALQFAIEALPLAEQTLVIERLRDAGVITVPEQTTPDEVLTQFAPLIDGIVAVANGDLSDKDDINAALDDIERKGWHIRRSVLRIWQGERRRKRLTHNLDPSDAKIIERVLDLLEGASK